MLVASRDTATKPRAISMNPLCIALARPEQAAEISRLIKRLAHYFVPDASREAAHAFLATFEPPAIAALLADASCRYYAATQGDALVGVCALKDGRKVHHLFVASEAHGRGVARALWARAGADARSGEAAAEDGAFSVNSSVYAVPVYERLGFRPTGPQQERNGVRFVPMELTAAR
jgi:GNAT superfamily N-acetyltransferase